MPDASTPCRLVHITTTPFSLWNFLGGQNAFMKARGFEVHGVSSPGALLEETAERDQIPVHVVPMDRAITPLADLGRLLALWRCFRAIAPAIVHAHTPKGGLLGILAAWFARTPVRIYHIRGFPFMSAKGLRRLLLQCTERIACRFATKVLCVSPSIRDVAIDQGICPAWKITAIGRGSGNGVDAEGRFNPARWPGGRQQVRRESGIPAEAMVVGFVGRLVRDKGICELAAAWRVLREEFPQLHLLLVGPFEKEYPLPPEVDHLLRNDARIHLTGLVPDTSRFYLAMDVFAFPTYREGFGMVALEAAAMEVPVVATKIPGCVDSVQEGSNGTLVPPQDSAALAEALRGYLCDGELRRRHGRAGRGRALRDFCPRAIWEATYQEYLRLLAAKGIPAPKPRVAEPAAPVRRAA